LWRLLASRTAPKPTELGAPRLDFAAAWHYRSGMDQQRLRQRRSFERRPVVLLYGSSKDPRLFGKTRDLSKSGVFVETSLRPELESVLEISLAWRTDVWSCRARVARHAADGLGLVFIEPSPEFLRGVAVVMDAVH
jgi:hypothetical protein